MEGRAASQQHVGDDADRPHVRLRGVRLEQHLRGNVMDGAARLRHPGGGVPELGEAEVDELQEVRVLLRIEEVLELEITMRDLLRVQVGDCEQDLVDGVGCLALAVALLSGEPVIELAALHVLHDEVNEVVRLEDHVKLSDVRVVELQVQLHLVLQVMAVPPGEAALLETLHRVLPAVGLALGQADGAIHASAQDGVEEVVVLLQVPVLGVAT
mmetsp:Transcript_38802/g.88203  ORF Transcript_38802/g.88203 Transcript_38802/m.88203 type:complete len:213 (+) Transcript_38802:1063-1701(+)